MNRDDDPNYISVGSWMLMLFLAALPGIGLIVILVLAFTGQNQTRKNYFRALIAWFVLALVLMVIFGLICGMLPQAFQKLQHHS
jgi:Na+-driven multidrug efflux pump